VHEESLAKNPVSIAGKFSSAFKTAVGEQGQFGNVFSIRGIEQRRKVVAVIESVASYSQKTQGNECEGGVGLTRPVFFDYRVIR